MDSLIYQVSPNQNVLVGTNSGIARRRNPHKSLPCLASGAATSMIRRRRARRRTPRRRRRRGASWWRSSWIGGEACWSDEASIRVGQEEVGHHLTNDNVVLDLLMSGRRPEFGSGEFSLLSDLEQTLGEHPTVTGTWGSCFPKSAKTVFLSQKWRGYGGD